jgi:tryptophan-rich sensory protein
MKFLAKPAFRRFLFPFLANSLVVFIAYSAFVHNLLEGLVVAVVSGLAVTVVSLIFDPIFGFYNRLSLGMFKAVANFFTVTLVLVSAYPDIMKLDDTTARLILLPILAVCTVITYLGYKLNPETSPFHKKPS